MIRRIIEPRISLEPITIPLEGSSQEAKESTAKNTGIKPDVFYNNYQIPAEYIDYLEIDSTGFIPTFRFSFKDPTDVMADLGYPLDDTLVSVFIRSSQEGLNPIRADFKIMDYNIYSDLEKGGEVRSYYMSGVLNVNEMYISRQEFYKKMTSRKAMESFATKYGLGFATNIEESADEQTWIRYNVSGRRFINEVSTNAYLSDEAFMYSFMDLYYNLNYVDLEGQMREDAGVFKGLVNPLGLSSSVGTGEVFKTDSETKELILTNNQSAKNSNLFFSDWKIINQSTRISLETGYLTRSIFYDLHGNTSGKAGAWRQFDLDSLTTPGDETRSIILKGRPADPDFYKDNITNVWCAKLDKDNTHANYSYVQAQNSLNLRTLDKLAVNITMPQFNMNLFRFQKIRMHFSNQSDENVSGNAQINAMTGQWLISGMKYYYSASAGISQDVQLIKRTLNVSDLDA